MARHFLRLKLRLIRNGLRGRDLRLAGFIVGAIAGLALAAAGFAALALPNTSGTSPVTVAIVVFNLLFAGWLFFPLFAYGFDETLDPARLTLLPLTRRQLMGGLLLASGVGIAPLATVVALAGSFVGYGTRGPGEIVVAIARALEFGLCVAAARAISTALSRVLRRRRARGMWVVVVTLVAVGINLIGPVSRSLGRGRSASAGRWLQAILRWTPPGLAGRAVAAAPTSRWWAGFADLIPVLLTVLLMVAWWARNLERLMTTTEPPPQSAGETRPSRPETSRLARLTRLLPSGRRGVVAAKELLYMWREPAQRAQRISSGVFAVLSVVAVATSPTLHRREIVLSTAGLGWLFGLNALNLFAFDRAAYWTNVAASGDPAEDLAGKNLAVAAVHLPLFVVLAVIVAALTGGWLYLPLTLVLVIAATAMSCGVGDVVSVHVAYPMPESRTNMWANLSGQGCGAALVLMLVLFLELWLVAPVAVMIGLGLWRWRPLLIAAAPVALAYGSLLYLLGFRLASRWLRGHQVDLLQKLMPRYSV